MPKSPKSEHHWAEIQESRARNSTNKSDVDIDNMDYDASSPATPSLSNPPPSRPSFCLYLRKERQLARCNVSRMNQRRGSHGLVAECNQSITEKDDTKSQSKMEANGWATVKNCRFPQVLLLSGRINVTRVYPIKWQ